MFPVIWAELVLLKDRLIWTDTTNSALSLFIVVSFSIHALSLILDNAPISNIKTAKISFLNKIVNHQKSYIQYTKTNSLNFFCKNNKI